MSGNIRRVFLSGEGRNELGSRSGHPIYQNDEEPGVIQALLRRVRAGGWEVGGACNWKDVRKYRAQGASPRDAETVAKLAVDAYEADCDTLAFIRDRENEHERAEAISRGVEEAIEILGDRVAIIGGVAIPVLEGWILAIAGSTKTEGLSPGGAKKRLREKGVAKKDTGAMVSIVEATPLDNIPGDAESLNGWLNLARDIL